MTDQPAPARPVPPLEGAQGRRKRRRLNLNESRGAFDDPELDTSEDEMRYTEKACVREKVWTATAGRIMLKGDSSGYISKKLGMVDPRPAMSGNEQERLLEYCRARTNQSYPTDNLRHDELSDDVQAVFSDSFTTDVDTPQDAAAFLGLNLSHLTPESTLSISPLSTLRLRLDQVQNIAFMVKKGEGILRGCINGNNCGTGKTVETLATVYFMALRKAQDPNSEHKPVLVLCPPAAVRSWQRDYTKFFANLLTLTNTSSLNKEEIIREVQARLPGDPKTSCKIFLFTFSSFGTFLSKIPNEMVSKKTLSSPRTTLTHEQREALKSSEKEILFQIHTEMGPGKFGICVVDEAHEIKHPKSRKAQAQYLAEADVNFLLSATPTNNRISDLRGLLFALYRPEEWQLKWPASWGPEKVIKRMFADDFDAFNSPKGENMVPDEASIQYRAALADGKHLWRLNPALYRWLGHYESFQEHFSQTVHRAIMRICLLHRPMDSSIVFPNGRKPLSALLGIPVAAISTVELQMDEAEQDRYDQTAGWWFRNIFDANDRNRKTAALLTSRNEIPQAGFNKTMDWRLKTLTADIKLAQITRFRGAFDFSLGTQELDFDTIDEDNRDLGISFYYMVTRQQTDPKEPPATREKMLCYMLSTSPKMCWLLPKLREWKAIGKKVTIFCVHRLTQWFIERVCLLVGDFNFLSLTSDIKYSDRAKVIEDFNNPRERFDFLVTTFNVAGTSVELQGDCGNMIIFELPENIPAILNAIGRIHRLGQPSPQDVTILTLAKSYDDFMLARAFGKYAVELCGKEGFTDLARGLDSPRLRSYNWQLIESGGVTIKQALAGELMRRKFGMQWNRLGSVELLWARLEPRSSQLSGPQHAIPLKLYAGAQYEEVTLGGKMAYGLVVNGESISEKGGKDANADAQVQAQAQTQAQQVDAPVDGAEVVVQVEVTASASG